MQLAWKLGVVALIALALTVLPGGGSALDVALALLTVVFLAAIAFLGYRLYRQYQIDIQTLDPNVRLALYGSLALAILTIVGTDRLFDVGGAGVIVWFALLALCSYGMYWVWTRYRSYG
jgi:drug/metabolite transporter (DMT)-like permease